MWFLLSSFLVKIIVTKDSMEHGSLNSISFFIQFFYYCKRCVTFKLFGIKKFGDWFLHLLDAKAFPVNQLRILGFAPFTSHTSSFFFFFCTYRGSPCQIQRHYTKRVWSGYWPMHGGSQPCQGLLIVQSNVMVCPSKEIFPHLSISLPSIICSYPLYLHQPRSLQVNSYSTGVDTI